MMDLSSVIGAFSQGPLSATRYGAGARVDGAWVPGAATPVVFDPAVVLPLGPKEVDLMPEGLRTRQLLQLFTVDAPQVLDETAQTPGDRFVWLGETYEVQRSEPWGPAANYYRSVAVRLA